MKSSLKLWPLYIVCPSGTCIYACFPVWWPDEGHLRKVVKAVKQPVLALGSSRLLWMSGCVCLQTGEATFPAGCKGKPNSPSTERPLVLSLNSSIRIKTLEKQNIIAAVTTHWLPLPLCCRDNQWVLRPLQALFASQKLWLSRNIRPRRSVPSLKLTIHQHFSPEQHHSPWLGNKSEHRAIRILSECAAFASHKFVWM